MDLIPDRQVWRLAMRLTWSRRKTLPLIPIGLILIGGGIMLPFLAYFQNTLRWLVPMGGVKNPDADVDHIFTCLYFGVLFLHVGVLVVLDGYLCRLATRRQVEEVPIDV